VIELRKQETLAGGIN